MQVQRWLPRKKIPNQRGTKRTPHTQAGMPAEGAPGSQGSPRGARDQVRELIESFYTAFNSHDIDRVGEHLTEDFTQTTPYGASITKETLLEQWFRALNTGFVSLSDNILLFS